MTITPLLLASLLTGCGGAEEQPEAPDAKTEAPVEAPAKEEPPAAPAAPITIVSTKKETVKDSHTMTLGEVTLKLEKPGDLNSLTGAVAADLNSWKSPIDVRDQRVKEVFFKVADNTTATFTVTDATGFGEVAVGEKKGGAVKGTLAVAGGSFDAVVKLEAERKSETDWVFRTTEPFEFQAAQLGLSERVQEVAGLCGVPLSDTFTMELAVPAKL